MKTINVVAAVIVKNGTILATQRGYGEFEGGWEFPGGKIESGENPKDAIIREIHEELAATIEVDEFLCQIEYDYPTFHLSMKVFLCKLCDPHFKLLEHHAAKWLTSTHLNEVDWLPADVQIVDLIREKGICGN